MSEMRETLGKRIEIRAWGDDLSRWQDTSHKAGYRSVSEWIRRTLNDEAMWAQLDHRNRKNFNQSLREAVDALSNPVHERTQLENGVTVVTESLPGSRTQSLGIIVNCGVRDESSTEHGLAHLCEHLFFHGTSSRDAATIARHIDTAGGQVGAFTTRDYTCFYAAVLDDYSFHVLDLLGDLLLNSIFPESAIEREKRVILREMRAQQDDPSHSVQALLKESIWPADHLGRSIAGTTESLMALSREQIIHFVHRHYTPDRIIIAAAGGVQHENFVAQVRDVFWRLLGSSAPAPARRLAPRPGIAVKSAPLQQAYFALGIAARPYSHPERYAVHVLTKVLGSGLSSRLFRRLRDQLGIVYDIQAEYQAYRDAGLIVIQGSTEPEDLVKTIGIVLDELWSLFIGQCQVTDEELQIAKTQLRAEYSISGENAQTRMSRLATQELYFQKYLSGNEILQSIDAVNREALERLCQECLLAGLADSTLALSGPESVPAGDLELLLKEYQGKSRNRCQNELTEPARTDATVSFAASAAAGSDAPNTPYVRRGYFSEK